MAQCWICEKDEAEDLTNGGFDGKQLSCKSCGPYNVAGTVVLKLAELGPSEKVAALARARGISQPGQVPTISSTSLAMASASSTSA